ncbi:MAG TPA: excinuclease ABC subunit UvrC [Chloroflexota bacterium]|nr:excinuclease ABC subunit UvrC [Chloroflexota bacterium]
METLTAPVSRFPAAVEETLARLPAEPGCYLFKDASGTVLYVGKARSLRDRVRSYFRNPGGLSLKNRGLVPKIAEIDYQILPSEDAALLVECNLIKQYRPRYNILLRDDKTYIAIRVTNEPYPRIETVRRRSDDGARYFGPYTSSQSVYRTLDLLKRLFAYRSCRLRIVPPIDPNGAATQTEPPERVGRRALRAASGKPPQERTLTVASPQNRACLEYHIHRCTGPCINAISQAEYGERIEQATLLLQGKSEQLAGQLEKAMEEAAENMDFERAAVVRDQLAAVRRISERQRVTVMGGRDQDIVGLARIEDEACVELIAVREGKMLGHQQFTLQGVSDQEDGAILRAFLVQYYVDSTELPEELLLPAEPDDSEALGTLLTTKRGRKVTVTVPKRGDKAALLEVAATNARQSAELRRQKLLSDNQKAVQSMTELQAALGLPSLPLRIECYDISTIQGTSTVGSMVVFEQGKPKTAAYRRFRIKTVVGADDFASMAEMVRRRLKRGQAAAEVGQAAASDDGTQAPVDDLDEGSPAEEADDSAVEAGETPVLEAEDADRAPGTANASDWGSRPDLLLIDGGKGQLGAVMAVLKELGIEDQPVASLAKQHEEIFLPGRPQSILLPAGSQALFLVQRIRDEAHRFAITYHRSIRGKRGLESGLDLVPGIGPRRKKDLLRHFGSLAGIRKATLEEIAAVPGVGGKTALTIKEHLGEQ